jgi:tetratricopeptide (TPR) repeat protein
MNGRDALIASVLIAATLLVYEPAARHGFVNYDDPEYVTENAHVTAGLTGTSIGWAFTHAYAANWHPLTWLSHMLDCELFGLDPAGHHRTSVLLHAAAAAALFLVLAALTGAPWPSAAVAALFALHPLRVESVAWVSERKDVLSGLFWMLGLGAWVGWVRRPRPWRYALVVVTFVLALLAKPMAVTFPFVLLLLDWWPLRRAGVVPVRRLILEKLPLFALSALVSVITFVVQHEAGAVASLASVSPTARLANALLSYATYVGKTLWPVRLAVFYPFADPLPGWQVALALVGLALGSWLVLREARRRPYLAVGWLWFLGTLVPVIGLVRAGDQAMADRFTYVPQIGLLVMAVWGTLELAGARRRALALAAGVAVLGGCAALTSVQLGYWRDSATLFSHALAVTRDNHVAHTNLGETLVREGRLAEAEAHFAEALRIRPAYAKAHVNYGMALAGRGERRIAVRHYAEAVRLDPSSAMAHYNWGLALAEQGALDDAIGHYREALRLDPSYAKAHTNLGWALAAQGHREEAVVEYRAALRVRPDLATAHNNLAVTLEDLGRLDEAIAEYQAAVRLSPRDPRPRSNLAAALERAGRAEQAIEEYRAVVRLDPSAADAQQALARMLASPPLDGKERAGR